MMFTAGMHHTGVREELRRQVGDLRRTWETQPAARLQILLAVGIAFGVIVLAVLASVTLALGLHNSSADFLSLTRDRALPELVMDGLVLVAGIIAFRLFRETGHRSLLFVAATLVLIAVVDLTRLHEILGAALVPALGLIDVAGVPASAVGELVAFALITLCTLPALVWLGMSFTATDIVILGLYGAIVVLLAAFSIGVDAVHAMDWPHVVERLLGWAEDGSEIVVSSLFAALAILQLHGKALRRA